MKDTVLQRVDKLEKKAKWKKRLRNAIGVLACFVAAITVYVLMMPGETLQDTVYCGYEEHEHGESCYTMTLVCGLEEAEGHAHTDECYTISSQLTCGQEETEGHTHTDECYTEEQNLICTETAEDHVHTDACYEITRSLTCGQEETEGHTHTDECYTSSSQLTCGQEETEGHIHSAECYVNERTCGKEEHMHSLSCYADRTADLESAATWESSMADVALTGAWAEDVVAIAESQLGYTESEKNYLVDESGRAKGYTRYGAWYGDAYGDWCAMFVSFCLSYAEIPAEDMPREASCPRWVETLSGLGMYAPASSATDIGTGDIIFFDWDGDGSADHVGLVEEVTEKAVRTIEGNSGDQVQRKTYVPNDSDILGYGYLPQNPATVQPEEIEQEILEPETAQTEPDGAETETAEPAAEPETAQTEPDGAETETAEPAAEPETAQTEPDGAEDPDGTETTAITADVFTDETRTEPVSDVTVTVSGEFPEGVTATAWPVELELEGITVLAAYDVTLWLDGAEYQPASTVQVAIETPALSGLEQVSVYHITDPVDGEPAQTEPLTQEAVEDGAVLFETDSFSVFALGLEDGVEAAEEEVPASAQEETVYSYEDSYISVTAVPEDSGALPENAELKVTRVDAGVSGYNYDAYMQALNDSAGGEETYTADNTLLYDIAFLAGPDGEEPTAGEDALEYQPSAGQVSISFAFKDSQLSEIGSDGETDIQVVHLPLEETVREQNPTTSDATDICAENVEVEAVSAQVADQEVTFQLDGFSLVAFVTKEDSTVVEITDVQPGTPRTYRDILGDAVNYGITANTIDKDNHVDSNFAASLVNVSNHGADVGRYTNDNNEGTFIIGRLSGTNNLRIVGTTTGACATIYIPKEYENKVEQNNCVLNFVNDTESHLTQLVDNMIGYAKAQSDAMFREITYRETNIDQNNKMLDISEYSDGTYYIDGDSFLFANGTVQRADLKIKKKPGQTIVFNLSNTEYTLERFSVIDADTNTEMNMATFTSAVEPFAKTIVFNMPNATEILAKSGVAGVFIAPQATMTIKSTCSGWVVVDRFVNPDAEWHFVSQEVPKSTAIVGIYAEKTVDNNTPAEDQKFTFSLETWNGTEWTNPRTVENQGKNICFQNRYTNTETVTWYYRLSEVKGEDTSYQYDDTKYIIEVNITEDNQVELKASVTYYKGSETSACTETNKTENLTFNNTITGGSGESGGDDESGYVLPSTGGPGETPYAILGTGMTLTAGGLLVRKKRKKGLA